MYVTFNRKFQRKFEKLSEKVKIAFKKRLDIFITNKFDSRLRNHNLKGKYINYKSIDITGDWRAIYHELEDGRVEWVEFVEIGRHSNLYK